MHTILLSYSVNIYVAQRDRMGFQKQRKYQALKMPFHAAEQHNKKQKNGSADTSRFLLLTGR